MFYQSFHHFYRLIFSSLLLSVVVPSQRIVAQSSAAAGFRVLNYRAVTKPGIGSMLEQEVLGPDGTSTRLLTATPRGFALVAAAQSGMRNLYLLRKVRGDTVMLLLTDSLGRTLKQLRHYLPKMGGDAKALAPHRLFGRADGKGFVFTYPSGKSARPVLQVQALSPALAVLWQQQFTPTCLTAVEHIVASDTHLWLVLKEYLALSLRPRVLSFRLATGEVECNQPLAPNDKLDAAAVVPAGLLLLGTSDRRSSYAEPIEEPIKTDKRRDFALLLSPTGQRNFGIGLGWSLSGRPPHYRWKSACLLPDGSYQLIGETYRNVPNEDTFALGILGAGMIGAGGFGVIPLSGYLSERPIGLVLAQLSTTGQLKAVHELYAPEIMQSSDSKTTSNQPPPDYATSLRFRGFSSDHHDIVLTTTRHVLAYSVATQQLRPLVPARNATPTVLYIEPGHLAIRWFSNFGDSLPKFERVALP